MIFDPIGPRHVTILCMKRTLSNKQLPDSALKYLLEALLPYSNANLKLAFKPNLFFNDLENIAKTRSFNNGTYKNAYYKALKDGFIELNDRRQPRLTQRGAQLLRPFEPKKLAEGASLMIVFDIPESKRAKRTYLRRCLHELKFIQVQKSVWISKYDSKDYLMDELKYHKISPYVLLYEASQIEI
jgi:hypothetical protein